MQVQTVEIVSLVELINRTGDMSRLHAALGLPQFSEIKCARLEIPLSGKQCYVILCR